MAEERRGHGFYFVGERLSLDFINTEAVENDTRVDLLGGFEDLVAWSVAAHTIDAAQGAELLRRWRGKRDADRTFADAIELRTLLRAMAERLADGRTSVPHATVDRINDILRAREGDLQLVRTKEGYETRFRRRVGDPIHLLVPIAESAAELLSRGDPALVRKCQNPRCLLYFYDTTKNHARRWCSMTACGNRAKVAAHYRRTRQDMSSSS